MTIAVLSVASEVFPLIKTGGLADVVGALPGALAAEDVAVRTLVPGYPSVLAALADVTPVHSFDELFGGPARLLAGTARGLDLVVVDAPHLFDRPGNPYVGPDGRDWPDNPLRFAALSRAAAEIGLGRTSLPRPDVVHAHDWQAGLAPAYLHYEGGPRPGTVITVHNLAFQGQFDATLLHNLGLPSHSFGMDGVEYYGAVGYLKAGLQLADRLTTVSPTYAQEIRGPEAGMGLDGLLRARANRLSGIINGIDTTVWDPAHDPLLPAPYSARQPKGRALSKAALQQRFGLTDDPGALVFGVVSRLSWQKGLDLLLEALPTLLATGAQLVLLGAGEAALERGYRDAAAAHPGRVGCIIGYDEALAHLIQAGAEALIVPSRFEPCGLTQLCALRYGAIPVVSSVGGLADTIIDANEMAIANGVGTGLRFQPTTTLALEGALQRAASLHADAAVWKRLRRNAMATDVSWTNPARHYAALYRELAGVAAA
ncbi:glycogen synthase GlgA [Nitrospirillum iridis]|uniref:Glycogen synthase n=1 Tax=Nitrospirillum iridis TaxID=765888 RepID=A0A7X0AV49_9PROT|nr:glycogen synthase GlgA [Nitrospirillum iridis]MBB6250640.1 starch synthase [Nitrospirillum iridis]